MQITPTLLGQIAGILAVVQVIPYVISILKGETKPERTSYAIWFIIEVIGIVSYLAAGATTTKWVLIVVTFNSLLIFLLSIKRGMGGLNKFDLGCLALAIVAVFLWVKTDSPELAVYMSTLAGFMGYLPTIKKVYFLPRTENLLSWGIYNVAAFLNVCALTTLSPVIALPPLAGLICSLVVTFLIIVPRRTPRLRRTAKRFAI